jgi:hypothetical protein
MKPILSPLPTFHSGGSRGDISDRDALYEAMEGASPLSERYELAIEEEGRLAFPPGVQAALKLEPGDLFSLTRNRISIRLDRYSGLLEDLRRSVKSPWRCLEQFLGRNLVAVGPDGSVAIPPALMPLPSGEKIVLEIMPQGLRHVLYIYPADA